MLDETSAGQTICEAIAFHRLLRLVTLTVIELSLSRTALA